MNHQQKLEELVTALRAVYPMLIANGEFAEDPLPSWMEVRVSSRQVTIHYHEGEGFSVYEGKTRDLTQPKIFSSADHVLVLARLLRYFTPFP